MAFLLGLAGHGAAAAEQRPVRLILGNHDWLRRKAPARKALSGALALPRLGLSGWPDQFP